MKNYAKLIGIRVACMLGGVFPFMLLGRYGHDLSWGQLLVALFAATTFLQLLLLPRWPTWYLRRTVARSIQAEIEGK